MTSPNRHRPKKSNRGGTSGRLRYDARPPFVVNQCSSGLNYFASTSRSRFTPEPDVVESAFALLLEHGPGCDIRRCGNGCLTLSGPPSLAERVAYSLAGPPPDRRPFRWRPLSLLDCLMEMV